MSWDAALLRALEVAEKPAIKTFVRVDEATARTLWDDVQRFRPFQSWHSAKLPDVPAQIEEIEPQKFTAMGMPLHEFDPDNWKNKLRPYEMKGPMTYLARQSFLFERPTVVQGHEHFGFVKELNFTTFGALLNSDKFDPALFDSISYFGKSFMRKGLQWSTASNPDGLKNFFLASSEIPPTTASLIFEVGERQPPIAWRTVTRHFEKQPTPVNIEYKVNATDSAERKVRASAAALEHTDYLLKDPRPNGSTSVARYSYMNPKGLSTSPLPGLPAENITSLTVEYDTKLVHSYNAAPIIATHPII